jgi:tetratricopeptide (TPR) repeat protein
MGPWWIRIGLALGLIILVVAWALWHNHEQRQCRRLLARAREEMSHNRWGAARAALTEVLSRQPGWDEAAYELGVCEQARGRVDAAVAAWERVPVVSPLTGWIEVRRSRIEMDQGRFVECEALLRSAAARPGPHRAEARWGLVLLLRLEGRFEEAKRWLEEGFDQMSDPVMTLERLYRLDHDPYPTEGVRRSLEAAGDRSPQDDRVWLGRAHLATRMGQFDEARSWLDRCLKLRPDDLAVWRTRLDWAVTANLPKEARQTLAHLPASQEPATKPAELRAWFAARQGNTEAERAALRRVLELKPAQPQVLERLAEIEIVQVRREHAEELRRKRTELDQLRKEYEHLLLSHDPRSKAPELARLAAQLGRHFDSEKWEALGSGTSSVGAREDTYASVVGSSKTLADLLPEIAGPGRRAQSACRNSAGVMPRFSDDAEEMGLRFVQENGGAAGRLIPPVTSSGGVGLLDIDNDGWLDVYVVQGGSFPPDPRSAQPGDRLFHNKRNGTFEDVTEPSGIARMPRGYGHGVAVGDFDNDGYPDLFVTRWRSYALYHNRGDGTFEDVTSRSGLDGERDWPTSAAFADLDGDGDLDLYVCHYMRWDENSTRTCASATDPTIYNCSPIDFPSLPDHVFRNDGGRFVDVTMPWGFHDRDGRGLGVLAADLDLDGRVDLFVANDMTANYLFRNQGDFRFEETGLASGVAGNSSGAFQAGMGVACADLDGDGLPDLAVTNFYNESTSFFRNLGQGFFGDQTAAIGLAAPSRYMLGFGIAFLDADNDGWLDLLTANGHVHDGRPQFPWKMPAQLFRNEGAERLFLTDVSHESGAPFQVLRMARGLAAGDLDNDGRVDALLICQNEPLAFFHNRSEAGHFLTLRLEGSKSNRDAIGAHVAVACSGRVRVAQRVGGGSYQSAGDPRIHFGLGTATSVDWIEVRWPSGRRDQYPGVQADCGYLLVEGEKTARPMKGWNRGR